MAQQIPNQNNLSQIIKDTLDAALLLNEELGKTNVKD